MKEINAYSKRGNYFILSFWNSEIQLLNQAYSKYSHAKYIAWKYCLTLCNTEGGNRFRIISYNTMQFTAAWLVGNDLRIETRDSSYIIKKIILPF